MWFTVVCILTKRVRDITVVKMMWTNFDHCEDGYSLSVRVQTTLNHIRFVTPNVSFRAQAQKGIARHIDSSSLVWTLIENAKLASQVARLVAIVVKIHFEFLALYLNKKFILQFDLLLKREFI